MAITTEELHDRFERHVISSEWLHAEAEILDNREYDEWLEFLTDDIEYLVLNRLSRAAGEETSEFTERGYHMRENRTTLEARVNRFQREYAWAENPPSRTRRFVTNVRPGPIKSVDNGNEMVVKNNVFVIRLHQDETDMALIPAERHDTLRETDGEWRLAKRTVYPDFTAMGTRSLSIFL